jgi:hypothetical protein
MNTIATDNDTVSSKKRPTNDRISQNSDSTIEDNVNKAIPFKMPRAPPHVYSCFVVNRTAQPIECNLKYDGCPGNDRFDES